MLLDPRNTAAWDLPPYPGERRTYVIASIPRSGSTLLGNTLWDTHRVGAPKEYLNPMQVRDWEARLGPTLATRLRHHALWGPAVGLAGRGPWSQARLAAYLERVTAHRTDPSGWFGLKLHHHHHARWFTDRGWSMDALLPVSRWIAITREDHVAQAVSWARALQSGAWASWQRPWRPAAYNRALISRQLAAVQRAEAGWERFFAAQGVAPVRVTYESLLADREATVRRVLSALDISEPVALPTPTTAPQADATSAAWIRRYREEST